MVHGDVLYSFHIIFTYGFLRAIIISDHGSLVDALARLVSTATTCEALDRTCLDGIIWWCQRRRIVLVVACRGRVAEGVACLKLDLSPVLSYALVEVGGVEVVVVVA